jgi:uncharacterized membrane-anchored protein YitT (DUF2179 family)
MNEKVFEKIRLKDFLVFMLGTALYAWGLVNVNIPNNLAEGGVSGITLILRGLFGINPAISTIILNIPLLLIGYHYLGRKALIYTLFGISALSFWLWVWQLVPMHPNLQHDMLISALLAGLFGGIGSGIIYRYGGTTGGTDVIARILEQKSSIPMGQTLFTLDVVVLLSSLVYINVVQMVYTLIASFVFAQVVNFTQQGAYSARAFMIFSTKAEDISHAIMEQLERGTSLLHSEGGFTHNDQRVVYVVVDPSELNEVREIIKQIDEKAFVSIFNVQETLGEGFTYGLPNKKKLLRRP